MTATKKLGGVLTGTLLAGAASLALAGPAEAVLIPCDTPPCGVVEPPRPVVETPHQVDNGGEAGTDAGEIALGALGGAAVTGLGVATVALARRRPGRPRPA